MKIVLIRTLLKALSLLPLPLSHLLGTLIGLLFWIIPNRNKRVTEANLAFCFPDASREWRTKIARQCLIETGKNFTELGAIWFWDIKRLQNSIKKISGQEHLDHALAQKKGIFVVAPHIGAWELIGVYCSQIFPMTTLFRPPRMEAMSPIMRQARERLGGKIVPTDARGVKALFQALAKGEAAGMLPDQEPRRGSGIFAPFFGKPTYTMVLLSRLAKKTKAVPVFAFMERLPNGKGFHLHWLPVADEIYSNDMEVSATALNQAVEKCININPSQYMWTYKRFRQRPDGETGIY